MVLKKDWKLFREKLVLWQESYMDKLLREYTELLNKDLPASSKFWALEERIKEDKKKKGVMMRLVKRNMLYDIRDLLNEGAITMEDLQEFSDELRDQIEIMQERLKNIY